MKRDSELSKKLREKMAMVIGDSGEISQEESLELATKAEKEIEGEATARRDKMKQALMEKQRSVLRAMGAEYDKPEYEHVFERTSGSIIKAFEKYQRTNDFKVIDSTYPDLEKIVIANFIAAVPRATGQASAVANDRLDHVLDKILEEAGIELSYKDRAGLVNALRDLFRIFAGLSKVGLPAFADIKYQEGEGNILANLQGLLSRSRNTAAETELEKHVIEPLRVADLPVSDYQLRTIADQILWLFRDFVQAPDDKKDEVYKLGEDRIVFSTFDSHYLKSSMPAG